MSCQQFVSLNWSYSIQLLLTVKTLKKEFARILVIGKLHMYVEKDIIKQIKELGDVYLVDNE